MLGGEDEEGQQEQRVPKHGVWGLVAGGAEEAARGRGAPAAAREGDELQCREEA